MIEAEAAPQAAGAEQWIREARRGSRAALDRLFGAYLPYLLVAAHQDLGTALRSRIDSADVVQDTLIEACRDFASFRGESAKDFLAWLRGILHHNLANERRRHIATAMRSVRCEVRLSETALNQLQDLSHSEWEPPSKQAQVQERSEALERALRQLPEHYRQVLLLHGGEELTYAEVGQRLNCSAEAARKLWRRAAEELVLLLRNVHQPPRKG